MFSKKDEPPLRSGGSWKEFLRSKTINLFYKAGDFCSHTLFELKNVIKSERKLAFNFLLLAILAFVPWISEASYNQEIYAGLKKYIEPIDPINAGRFSEAVKAYTPGIEANADEIALSIMAKNDSYSLDQQLALNIGKEIDGPERQDATYVVQRGESVTTIAEKFDLHVGTILEANNIKAEDSKKIKEGVVLNIPSTDTTTSNDWLVAINAAEEKERQAAAARQAEAQKQKQLALAKASKAYAATSSSTSSAYSGVDTSELGMPISSNGISQYFGRGHTGTDFMADVGTPVYASASGKVVKVSTGWSGGYGNQIVIDHGGGRATRYAHLSKINVDIGQNVGKGEVIGLSGNTGRSTGPHLHFEVIINGTPVRFR